MSIPPNSPSPRTAEVDWRDIAAKVGDLPPMPHVAARAVTLVENPEATANALSDILAKDTALAARVLKIANSAMFSRQRKITTLNQAVMTIGFKGLKGIIIAAALRQMNKSLSPTERLVWERSLATAICATLVTRHLKRRYVDEIFLAGLLHSLGQVVLLSKADTAERYSSVLEIIEREGLDFVSAEERAFGFSHPLLGAIVAKKWNFSADTCQVILHYRDQLEGATEETEEQALVVRLAEIVSHLGGIGSPDGYPNEQGAALALLTNLGIDPSDAPNLLQSLIEDTRAQFEQERHLYE
jgi:HD-like signal output (HDOD) protein